MSKSAIMRRLEPNTSLDQLLTREYLYKEDQAVEYYKQLDKAEAEGVEPVFTCDRLRTLDRQEKFELSFSNHEKNNHNIPEDYGNFVKRN